MFSVIARSINKASGIARLRSLRNVSSLGTSNVGLLTASKSVNRKYGTKKYDWDNGRFDGLGLDYGVGPEESFSLPIIPLISDPLNTAASGYVQIPKNHLEFLNKKVKEDDAYVGYFLVKDEKNKDKVVKSVEDLYPVGMFAKIYDIYESGIAYTQADRRIWITDLKTTNVNDDILIADVKNVHPEDFELDFSLETLIRNAMKTIDEIIALGGYHGRYLHSSLSVVRRFEGNPEFMCEYAAFMAAESGTTKELQQIVEERNIPKRLELCWSLLKKDLERRSKIDKDVYQKMETSLYRRPTKH